MADHRIEDLAIDAVGVSSILKCAVEVALIRRGSDQPVVLEDFDEEDRAEIRDFLKQMNEVFA